MSLVLDPPPSPASTAAIDRLRAALADVRRQARRWIWLESLGLVCLVATGFFWAALLFDWCFEPSREVRLVMLVAVGLGLTWLVATKLAGRLATPLDDARLALAVERTHPQFRDSLSTAVELSSSAAAGVDAELLGRTAATAAALVDGVRADRLFRRQRLMLLALVAGMAVATVATLAGLRPDIAARWARRMTLASDEPWPRAVLLEAEGFSGGTRVVARGTDVEVIVRAAASHQIPDVVDLRWRPAAARGRGWRWERMGTRGGATAAGQLFGHVLKTVGEPIEIEVRGGDAWLRPLRLDVVDPPALATLAISARLPEYLGGGTRSAPAARIVQLPRGSSVEIEITATKPLASATMTVVADGEETPIATLAGGSPPGRTLVGRIEGIVGEQTIGARLTDTHGLPNREPITFVLSAVPDEPPRVAARLRGISSAVVPRGRLPVQGTITDDHGLAAAAIRLRLVTAEAEAATKPPLGERLQPLAAVRPGAAVVELSGGSAETVMLEPLALAPGQRIEVAVTATDTCGLDGGANQATSETWSLDVVSPEALQAMLEAREVILRRRFEAAIADLGQSRDRLAAVEGAAVSAADAGRLAEAAARATGETGEIAAAFREIRLELDNNQLLSPELDTRLVARIATPLEAIAAGDLPALVAACRVVADPARGAAAVRLVRQADDVLTKMRNVLDMMMELESFNEVVERLRGVIRVQEEIRTETIEQQKKRAREALEGP
jgi:hypothetical protein